MRNSDNSIARMQFYLKMDKGLLFSHEDIHVASRFMKKCSASLITWELQIKIMMRNPLSPVRMSLSKAQEETEKGTLVSAVSMGISAGAAVWDPAWRVLTRGLTQLASGQYSRFQVCTRTGITLAKKDSTFPIRSSVIPNSRDAPSARASIRGYTDGGNRAQADNGTQVVL